MSRNLMVNRLVVARSLMLASVLGSLAFGQQPVDDPFAPKPTPKATQPAPKPVVPPAVDDPFAPVPTPKPPVVQPVPPVVPPPQPAVQPVPTPRPANPAPIILVPVNPAPVNPAADGDNYGPPGTTVIVIAANGRYYPWGNTKGNWVPFYYNKQWHLYRSWCQ